MGLSSCTRLLMSHTLPLMYRYIYPLPDSKSGAVCHCSEQCQASDWAARHKATCSEAAENREQMEIVGEMLLIPAFLAIFLLGVHSVNLHGSPPEVTSRTTQGRSDAKKEKLGHRSAESSASAPNPLRLAVYPQRSRVTHHVNSL